MTRPTLCTGTACAGIATPAAYQLTHGRVEEHYCGDCFADALFELVTTADEVAFSNRGGNVFEVVA